MSIRRFRAGDTLVEVLIAITVFSLVVVTATSIMSSGVASTQRALESTEVRQEIDSQAATLRFMHNAFVTSYVPNVAPSVDTPAGQWYQMINFVKASGLTQASQFGSLSSSTCAAVPNGSFILNTRKAKVSTAYAVFLNASVYSKVNYDSANDITTADGIWIEGIRSATSSDVSQSNIGYIDFHIRACWNSVGQTAPLTLGTIVRLYDPR